MTIDPKISAILNLLATLLSALAGGTAEYTTLFGTGNAQHIVAIIGLAGFVIGGINTYLHSVSAPVAGPLVK